MADVFHLKYRPTRLSQIIGHEVATARLQGVIKTNKFPNAFLITGPTSVGKTTLARCFAADVLDSNDVERHPDYLEKNAGSEGGIDDVRELVSVSLLHPMRGKKRFIVIDEAQKLTGAAANAILKPLEQPPKNTVFILCSMEPEKFASGAGRAIANRCSQLMLESPTLSMVARYLMRICKSEKLSIDKEVIKKIARFSSGEMRAAASLLESIVQYTAGTDEKVSEDDILKVLKDSVTVEDELAVRILVGVYSHKFSVVQKAILDAGDSFTLINKLLHTNAYVLNRHVLKDERHPKVWPNVYGDEVIGWVNKLSEQDSGKHLAASANRILTYATTQAALVSLRQQAASFLVPEQNLISACLYSLIRDLRTSLK